MHARKRLKGALNSGEKLADNKGSEADYTRKGGVLFSEIALPAGSPEWADNRGELWRRLEAREDRSTSPRKALLAHNIDIALPHELTLEQNIFLARDFVREQFTRKGYAVDWAIHAADPRGDSRNIHLHILVPLRKIAGESFGNKARYSRNELRQQVIAWRKSWANLANRHLKRYGHKKAIDERSLKAQGSKRTPTRHRGPQPKTKRAVLDKIRPPQPKRPIIRTLKRTGRDGSINIQAVIRNTGLVKIGPGINPIAPVRPSFFPSARSNGGWPPAAIADWKAWGHRETVRFFAKWPELGGGLSPQGGNHR